MHAIRAIYCWIILLAVLTSATRGKSLHGRRTHSDDTSDNIAKKHWRPQFPGTGGNLAKANFHMYSYNRPVLRANRRTRRPTGDSASVSDKRKPSAKSGIERMFSDFNIAMDNDLRIHHLMEELVMKSRLVEEYPNIIFERMENDLYLATDDEQPRPVLKAESRVADKKTLDNYDKDSESDFTKSGSTISSHLKQNDWNTNTSTSEANRSTAKLVIKESAAKNEETSSNQYQEDNLTGETIDLVASVKEKHGVVGIDKTTPLTKRDRTDILKTVYLDEKKNTVAILTPDPFVTKGINKTVLKQQLDYLQMNAPKIQNQEDLNEENPTAFQIDQYFVLRSKVKVSEAYKLNVNTSKINTPNQPLLELNANTDEGSFNRDSSTKLPSKQVVRPVFSNSILKSNTMERIINAVTEDTVTSQSDLQNQTPASNTEDEVTRTIGPSQDVVDESTNAYETIEDFQSDVSETSSLTRRTPTENTDLKEHETEATTDSDTITISSVDVDIIATVYPQLEHDLENKTLDSITNKNEAIPETMLCGSYIPNTKNQDDIEPSRVPLKPEMETDIGATMSNIRRAPEGLKHVDEEFGIDNITEKSKHTPLSLLKTTDLPKPTLEKLSEYVTSTVNCYTSPSEIHQEAEEIGDHNIASANILTIQRTHSYRYDTIAEPHSQSHNEISHSQDIAGHEKSDGKEYEAIKDRGNDDANEMKIAQMSANEKEMFNILKMDHNNTYKDATTIRDTNEGQQSLADDADESDNNDDEIDFDGSGYGGGGGAQDEAVSVEEHDDVEVAPELDDNADNDDDDEEVVSNDFDGDTAGDAGDYGGGIDVTAASAIAENDSAIQRTPLAGGEGESSYDRRRPDMGGKRRNESGDDAALALLTPTPTGASPLSTPCAPSPSPMAAIAASNGDTATHSAALKQLRGDPDIKTTNWWQSLSYAEIRNFLNTIFDTATHQRGVRAEIEASAKC